MTQGIDAQRVYLPGLDGLRALSVLVVVAFHCGIIDGGWIGVDVFFGISGFLITGLLVAEHSRGGRISLGAFWARRIRRLVPALIVLLALVAVLARFDQVEVRERDVWGALTYSTNWVHILGGVSYWDHFSTPDPLRHLWSLAIEEQFYVVWPVVVVTVLRRHSQATLMRIAAAGAALSAVVQIVGITAGLSVDRVYQGTDTRAVPFLLGALIACGGWPPRAPRVSPRLVSAVAAAVLLPAAVWLPGDRTWVFLGALIVVSAAGALAVWTSATSSSRLLSWPPLRAIGRWSYGIYLFHWPLAVSGRVQSMSTPVRFAAVTTAATLMAALSYRFIESPVRHRRWDRRAMTAALATAAVIVVATLAPSGGAAPALDTTVTLAPQASPSGSDASDLSSPDQARRVMVFGDSVPAVAADELREVADQLGLEIEVRADPGCVPSEDKRDQYGKPECVDFLKGTGPRAAEIGVDVAVIWWGGTGRSFVEAGELHDFCESAAHDITRERIRRLVAYFDRDDGPDPAVVLVTPVPRTDNGAEDAAGTECEITAYHDVATELGLTVVDLRDTVCPSYPDDCDRVHRYDGLHYNDDAATAVARLILTEVAAAVG